MNRQDEITKLAFELLALCQMDADEEEIDKKIFELGTLLTRS